jgi:hypothetical protein
MQHLGTGRFNLHLVTAPSPATPAGSSPAAGST